MRKEIVILDRAKRPLKPISAVVIGAFGYHKTIGAPGYNITHLRTGAAISTNWHRAADCKQALKTLEAAITSKQMKELDELDYKQGKKSELLKRVYNWLKRQRDIENNKEIESIAGVFYADRADAAKLLKEIGVNI